VQSHSSIKTPVPEAYNIHKVPGVDGTVRPFSLSKVAIV
jgi:hypothetical protein